MTLLSAHAISAIAQLDSPVELSIEDASVTLDDSWAPYVQIRLTCSMPDEADLDQLDPREGVRVDIELEQSFEDWNSFGYRAPVTRTFDVLLVGRTVDFETHTVTLTLESDEALLRNFALVSATPERVYGLSVKDAVEYALDKVGATLQPGAADVDVESDPLDATVTNLFTNPSMETSAAGGTITNLVRNPNFRTSVGNWTAFGANATLTRQTGLTGSPVTGVTTYSRTTMTGTGTGGAYSQDDITSPYSVVTPSTAYMASVWVRANVAKDVSMRINWVDGAGASLGAGTGSTVTLVANTWTRITQVFTSPAGAVRAGLYCFVVSPATWASGNTFDTLGWMLTAGPYAHASFDGTTTDTENTYTYAGTANASASIRTAVAPAGYTAVNALLTRTATHAIAGTYAVRVDMNAGAIGTTGLSRAFTVGSGGIVASTSYKLSAWVYVPTGTADIRLRVAGAGVTSTVTGTPTTSKDAFVRLDVSFTTAASGAFTVFLENGAVVASFTSFWADELMLNTGDLVDYFDGATTDTEFFDFAWTGTAHAATSTKTAIPNSDVMIWEPGVTGWGYLAPLLQATNLYLYCDELRRWYLIESGTIVDGLLLVGVEQNATAATDTISILDSSEFYTGVLIRYTWTDSLGDSREEFDTAGTGDKVLTIEYDRPYPGPGAAAFVLARAEGRGRVFDLEAMSDYTTTPRMTIVATLPNTPIQTGSVSSVEWRLPDNRMRVRSRGLADTPPTSWLLADVGLAWDEVAVGIDWTEYTP